MKRPNARLKQHGQVSRPQHTPTPATHPQPLQLAALQHSWCCDCCCHHELERQALDTRSTSEGTQALHVAWLLGQGTVWCSQHLLKTGATWAVGWSEKGGKLELATSWVVGVGGLDGGNSLAHEHLSALTCVRKGHTPTLSTLPAPCMHPPQCQPPLAPTPSLFLPFPPCPLPLPYLEPLVVEEVPCGPACCWVHHHHVADHVLGTVMHLSPHIIIKLVVTCVGDERGQRTRRHTHSQQYTDKLALCVRESRGAAAVVPDCCVALIPSCCCCLFPLRLLLSLLLAVLRPHHHCPCH